MVHLIFKMNVFFHAVVVNGILWFGNFVGVFYSFSLGFKQLINSIFSCFSVARRVEK